MPFPKSGLCVGFLSNLKNYSLFSNIYANFSGTIVQPSSTLTVNYKGNNGAPLTAYSSQFPVKSVQLGFHEGTGFSSLKEKLCLVAQLGLRKLKKQT